MLEPTDRYPAAFDVVWNRTWIRPQLTIRRVWYFVWLLLLVNVVWLTESIFRLLYTLDGNITTNIGSLCVIDLLFSVLLTARYPHIRQLLGWNYHEAYAPATVLKGAAAWAGLLHSIIMLSSGYVNIDFFGVVTTGIILLVVMFLAILHAVTFWGRWYRLMYHISSYVCGILLIAFGITHFVAVQSWFALSVACTACIIEVSHLLISWYGPFYDWRAESNRRFNRSNITTMRLLPGNVVEVQFSWKEQYRAGQYVYVCIPVLGGMLWKPFSLSTAPYQRSKTKYLLAESATFHARCVGPWTDMLGNECQELLRLVLREEEERRVKLIVEEEEVNNAKKFPAAAITPDNKASNIRPVKTVRILLPNEEQAKEEKSEEKDIVEQTHGTSSIVETPSTITYPEIFIDGPHGILCPESLAPYQAFLFISGGIGVTPLQAIYNQLIFERQNNDKKFLSSFVWAVKEQESIIHRGLKKKAGLDEMRYMHFQPNLIDWSIVTKLSPTHHQLHFYLSRTKFLEDPDFQSRVISSGPTKKRFPAPRHLEFIDTTPLIVNDLIDTFHADCVRHNVNRSIVFLCGPQSMVDDVKTALTRLNLEESELELRIEKFDVKP